MTKSSDHVTNMSQKVNSVWETEVDLANRKSSKIFKFMKRKKCCIKRCRNIEFERGANGLSGFYEIKERYKSKKHMGNLPVCAQHAKDRTCKPEDNRKRVPIINRECFVCHDTVRFTGSQCSSTTVPHRHDDVMASCAVRDRYPHFNARCRADAFHCANDTRDPEVQVLQVWCELCVATKEQVYLNEKPKCDNTRAAFNSPRSRVIEFADDMCDEIDGFCEYVKLKCVPSKRWFRGYRKENSVQIWRVPFFHDELMYSEAIAKLRRMAPPASAPPLHEPLIERLKLTVPPVQPKTRGLSRRSLQLSLSRIRRFLETGDRKHLNRVPWRKLKGLPFLSLFCDADVDRKTKINQRRMNKYLLLRRLMYMRKQKELSQVCCESDVSSTESESSDNHQDWQDHQDTIQQPQPGCLRLLGGARKKQRGGKTQRERAAERLENQRKLQQTIRDRQREAEPNIELSQVSTDTQQAPNPNQPQPPEQSQTLIPSTSARPKRKRKTEEEAEEYERKRRRREQTRKTHRYQTDPEYREKRLSHNVEQYKPNPKIRPFPRMPFLQKKMQYYENKLSKRTKYWTDRAVRNKALWRAQQFRETASQQQRERVAASRSKRQTHSYERVITEHLIGKRLYDPRRKHLVTMSTIRRVQNPLYRLRDSERRQNIARAARSNNVAFTHRQHENLTKDQHVNRCIARLKSDFHERKLNQTQLHIDGQDVLPPEHNMEPLEEPNWRLKSIDVRQQINVAHRAIKFAEKMMLTTMRNIQHSFVSKAVKAIEGVTNPTDVETNLRTVYCGERYHNFSSENQLNFTRGIYNYKTLAELRQEQNENEPQDEDIMAHAENRSVPEQIKRIDALIAKASDRDRTAALYKACTSDCDRRIKPNVATRLHEALLTLDPDSHATIASAREAVLALEFCAQCDRLQGDGLCISNGTCTDLFRMLTDTFPHFVRMRTCYRKLTTIRNYQNFILMLNQYLSTGEYNELCQLIDSRPVSEHKHFKLDTDKPIDHKCCTDENVMRARPWYNKALDGFRSTVYGHRMSTCHLCMRDVDVRDLEEFHEMDDLLQYLAMPYGEQGGKQTGKKGDRARAEQIRELLVEACRATVDNDEVPNLSGEHMVRTMSDETVDNFSDIALCKSHCLHHLKDNGAIPPWSVLNGMGLDMHYRQLMQLNYFEKMLISKAKSMANVIKLKTYAKGRQQNLASARRGIVVHFPLSLQKTLQNVVDHLPNFQDTRIYVDSLPTKNANKVWRNLVDLHKVENALDLLKTINRHYRDVVIDRNGDATQLFHGVPQGLEPEAPEESDSEQEDSQQTMPLPKRIDSGEHYLTQKDKHADDPLLDHYSMVDANINRPAIDDTELFQQKRITATPYSIKEHDLDVLCNVDMFPTARFGLNHDREPVVKLANYVKARIQNADPRFRYNMQWMFECDARKDFVGAEQGIYAMCNKSSGAGMTAGSVATGVRENRPEMQQSMSTLMSGIRGSSYYWKELRGTLQAGMLEFGPPTWFLTLSVAEYQWEDMRQFLIHRNIEHHPNCEKLTTSELCLLDPVSVSVHFKKRMEAMWSVVRENPELLGPLQHHFYRVEYQKRGPPHVHALIWIKPGETHSPPVFDGSNKKELLEWIQSKITCERPDAVTSPRLAELVNMYQVHNCSQACMRTGVNQSGHRCAKCRHGFPRPPRAEATLNTIQDTVNSRNSSSRTKRLCELARGEDHQWINDYSPDLLLIWEANMDLQYVMESSMALCHYLTSYVTKEDKSRTAEVFKCLDKDKDTNLRSAAMKYVMCELKKRDVGIYETVDRLLQHDLYSSSFTAIRVNTTEQSRRMRTFKPWKEIQKLNSQDPESKEVFMRTMQDNYYPNRPDSMQHLSFYQTVREYDRVSSGCERQRKGEPCNCCLSIKGGIGVFMKRKKTALVKHYMHRPGSIQDEQYYHQLLMLHKPWTDEDKLKGGYGTWKAAWLAWFTGPDITDERRQELQQFIDARLKMMQAKEVNENVELKIAEPTDAEEVDDDEEPAQINAAEKAMNDMLAALDEELALEATEEDLNARKADMTTEQAAIFTEVSAAVDHTEQHKNGTCKCEEYSPLFMFVSGPAGTGKSYLIDILRDHIRLNYQGEWSVAVLAPTGIAAYNVKGHTIHRLLRMPVQKTKEHSKYEPAGQIIQSEMRKALKNLRLIIVDEVSMISNIMLGYMQLRLDEIFPILDTQSQRPAFSNVPTVVLGDLHQLSPVNASFCFEDIDPKLVKAIFSGTSLTVNMFENIIFREMTEVKRQTDPVFLDLLTNLRKGRLTKEHIDILEEKHQATQIDNETKEERAARLLTELTEQGKKPTCLVPTNTLCKAINDLMLKRNNINVKSIKAQDTGVMGTEPIGERKISETGNLEHQLDIGVGAKVLLRVNKDVKAGLINGAMGTVKDFEYDANDKIIGIVVDFGDHGGVRTVNKVQADFSILKNLYITRTQFPLSLAYALTIHKSQGMTLDCAILDLGNSIFCEAQFYVALSRCKRLSDVYIIDLDINKRTVKCDVRAMKFYNEQRIRLGIAPVTDYNDLPLSHRDYKKLPKLQRSTQDQLEFDQVEVATNPFQTPVSNYANFMFVNPPGKTLSALNSVIWALLHAKMDIFRQVPSINQIVNKWTHYWPQQQMESTQAIMDLLIQKGETTNFNSPLSVIQSLMNFAQLQQYNFQQPFEHEVYEQTTCEYCNKNTVPPFNETKQSLATSVTYRVPDRDNVTWTDLISHRVLKECSSDKCIRLQPSTATDLPKLHHIVTQCCRSTKHSRFTIVAIDRSELSGAWCNITDFPRKKLHLAGDTAGIAYQMKSAIIVSDPAAEQLHFESLLVYDSGIVRISDNRPIPSSAMTNFRLMKQTVVLILEKLSGTHKAQTRFHKKQQKKPLPSYVRTDSHTANKPSTSALPKQPINAQTNKPVTRPTERRATVAKRLTQQHVPAPVTPQLTLREQVQQEADHPSPPFRDWIENFNATYPSHCAFRNTNNTCYSNAGMSLLQNCSLLKERIAAGSAQNYDGRSVNLVDVFLNRMFIHDHQTPGPTRMVVDTCLLRKTVTTTVQNPIDNNFANDNIQHDAGEFLQETLSGLSQPARELFAVQVVSHAQCQRCKNYKTLGAEVQQNDFVVRMNVSKEPRDDLIHHFPPCPAPIVEQPGLDCDICQTKTTFLKQDYHMFFEHTKYLLLKYELFERLLITDHAAQPPRSYYAPPTHEPLQFKTASTHFQFGIPGDRNIDLRNGAPEQIEWRITGVICRSGNTVDAGHYWCYRLWDDGRFYEVNDDHVNVNVIDNLAQIPRRYWGPYGERQTDDIFLILAERV